MRFERGGTPDGEFLVMFVGTLRRCVAFQPYGSDGDILVVTHRVYGSLYLTQFRQVVVVVGIYHRPVRREVDVSRTGHRTAFHDFCLWLHKCQFGEKRLLMTA